MKTDKSSDGWIHYADPNHMKITKYKRCWRQLIRQFPAENSRAKTLKLNTRGQRHCWIKSGTYFTAKQLFRHVFKHARQASLYNSIESQCSLNTYREKLKQINRTTDSNFGLFTRRFQRQFLLLFLSANSILSFFQTFHVVWTGGEIIWLIFNQWTVLAILNSQNFLN